MRRVVALLFVALVVAMLPSAVFAADPDADPGASAPSSTGAPVVQPSSAGAPVVEASPTATPIASPDVSSDPSPAPAATPEPTPSPRLPRLDVKGARRAIEAQPLSAPVATTTSIILTYGSGTVGFVADFHIQTNPLPSGGTVDLLVDGSVVTTGTFPGDTTDMFLHWTPSATGDFIVTARYNGTTGFSGSTSADFPFPVVLPTPFVQVDVSKESPAFGETVDFTATLSPNPGTGTIEWSVDDVLATTVPLEAGGVSHFSTSFSTPYGHSVKAHFTGTAGYLPSTGNRNVSLAPLTPTVTVTLPPDPIIAGPVTASVTLSPNPGGGTLTWHTCCIGYTEVAADADGTTDVPLGDLAPGPYGLYVTFSGYGQYAGADGSAIFTVLHAAAVTLSANRASATQGELPVTLSATVTPHDYGGGNVTFLDDVGGAVVSFGPIAYDVNGAVSYTSSALRVGVHTIRARFDGIAGALAPAVSDPIAVTVAADTAVHASFKPSASLFYPHADAYRDTVTLGGSLDERASVTIRVYSSSGALRRTFSLGTRSAGSYSAAWNGKTATGAKAAAGKYTVKASFRDVKGHTRTIVGYTTVSWREVAWKTTAAVTRYADQFSYFATPGDHLYLSDDYARGRTLYSAYINRNCDPNCAIVYGTTTFTLTSSALAYRAVNVTITGHSFVDYNPGDAFFVTWSTNKASFKGPLPEYIAYPYTYPASPTTNVSADRKVRFGVWCTEDLGDAFDLHYVRFSYQYAVWKP